MTGKRENFYINEDVKDVLKRVKENTPGINNMSQALRYIVLQHDNQTESKEDKKYNAISKEVSMILEITANIAEKQNVLSLKPVSELSSYTEAKGIVEDRIQHNTTKAMKYKNQSFESKEIETPVVSKWDD